MKHTYYTYFDIEKVVITPGAKELLIRENISTSKFLLLLERHKFNDDDNTHLEDLKANAQALQYGGMFLSVFNINKEKLYIISYIQEPTLKFDDRKAIETTILLPSEY